MSVPIISVTGTKGKTTTVAVIADILQRLGKDVLKVDTTGHFLNGERRSTLEDSKKTWKLVPSVCPGRYLWEFHAQPELQSNGAAVLECALGCSALSGLGYRYHDVGVFLNVFEDHIGSSERIKSKADIAKAKSFIFSRLRPDLSYAVFNADDELVVSSLVALPKDQQGITLVPVGITFSAFDIEHHLQSGGVVFTINDNKEVVLKRVGNEEVIADLRQIPWAFGGEFTPSVWNILSAIAALYGYFKGELPTGFRQAVESVRLDKDGGRLTLLESPNGVKILADYAHEKVSLALVAQLARSLTAPGGRVIGVVRLAHDRTDELIAETGEIIAKEYDRLIVYDKIDGFLRKPDNAGKGSRFKQVTGRTSQVLTEAIQRTNSNVTRIVREDEAITYAAEQAESGDVVVVIVNDDIRRSIGFITSSFKAEFV